MGPYIDDVSQDTFEHLHRSFGVQDKNIQALEMAGVCHIGISARSFLEKVVDATLLHFDQMYATRGAVAYNHGTPQEVVSTGFLALQEATYTVGEVKAHTFRSAHNEGETRFYAFIPCPFDTPERVGRWLQEIWGSILYFSFYTDPSYPEKGLKDYRDNDYSHLILLEHETVHLEGQPEVLPALGQQELPFKPAPLPSPDVLMGAH